MGILDEAIREHLELKRQHGAGESELKQLEDEAFGPPERPASEEAPPGELAEAPTEFMAQPEVAEPPEPVEEGPEAGGKGAPEPLPQQPRTRQEPTAEIADLQEAPREPDVEEEAPAMEHEAVSPAEIEAQREAQAEPEAEEPSPGPSTEERREIADQPTELYDVAGEEFADSEPAAPVDDTGSEAAAPADDEEDDDFFDERRLSDELDQALEAPPKEAEPAGEPDAAPEDEELEGAEGEEDLLEETPDFLEEAPEDDRLWFEQKPPKDFDFDD